MRNTFRVETLTTGNICSRHKNERWYRTFIVQYKEIFIIHLCVYDMNISKMRRTETNRVRISYEELPPVPVWFCAKYLKVSKRTQAWKLLFKIFLHGPRGASLNCSVSPPLFLCCELLVRKGNTSSSPGVWEE